MVCFVALSSFCTLLAIYLPSRLLFAFFVLVLSSSFAAPNWFLRVLASKPGDHGSGMASGRMPFPVLSDVPVRVGTPKPRRPGRTTLTFRDVARWLSATWTSQPPLLRRSFKHKKRQKHNDARLSPRNFKESIILDRRFMLFSEYLCVLYAVYIWFVCHSSVLSSARCQSCEVSQLFEHGCPSRGGSYLVARKILWKKGIRHNRTSMHADYANANRYSTKIPT